MTAIAEAAALAALDQDTGWMRRTVGETVAVREHVVAALRAAGHSPLPSDANFILLPVEDATSTAAALLTSGIHVRVFTALPGIGDALRITIGPLDVMRLVLDRLMEVG